MKIIAKISMLAVVMAVSFSSYATDYDSYDGLTCFGKQKAIQTQLDKAKQYKKTYKVAGLEKALNDVLMYCTNDKLERKYKENVQDEREDLAERQEELRKAKASGKLDKIAKQEIKLKEAEYELTAAENKLAAFYKELKAEK